MTQTVIFSKIRKITRMGPGIHMYCPSQLLGREVVGLILREEGEEVKLADDGFQVVSDKNDIDGDN